MLAPSMPMRALSALARPEYNATRALELCDWPAGAVGSSQNQEDIALFVTFFCGHTKPGTFVEIGALDGHLFSNSLFFEEYLGWKGVLIEGAPGNAKKLMREGNRPASLRFPVAVCPPGQRYVEMLGSVGPVSADVTQAGAAFKRRWHLGREGATHRVECRPFGEILRTANATDVDFVSLDVEGAELKVLETMDWENVRVYVWLVELDGLNATKDQSVRDLLHSHRYCQTPPFLRDFCTGVCTHNEVFVRSDAACPHALSQLVREDGDPYARGEAGPLQRARAANVTTSARRRRAKHHMRNQPSSQRRRVAPRIARGAHRRR